MNGRLLFGVSVLIAIGAIGFFVVSQRIPGPATDAQNVNEELPPPGGDQRARSETFGGFSIPTELSDEFEEVYGYTVRINRNCTVELRYDELDDETLAEGVVCVPNEPDEPGVYDSYDDETLAGMSYADALAAEVLGKRLVEEDPDLARTFLLRSVALEPDNIQPLLWLASGYYSLVSENGQPAFFEMSENYLLKRIAEELGTPDEAYVIRQMLVEAGLEEQEFAELERAVAADLAAIREIQLEVTGKSDIPETLL